MKLLSRLARVPWLVFLVVGGLLYAIYPQPDVKPTIVIPGAQVSAWLAAQRQQLRAPLTREEEQRALERMVMEEILVREALAHDFQRLPPVQLRLRQLGEFLQADGAAAASDADAAAAAQRLGLLQSDPVIRSYLVSTMERALVGGAAIEVGQQELLDYFERHRAEYLDPARLDLQHVFFSADKGRTRADAEAALARVAERGPGEEGDVFFSGYVFADRSERQLAAEFGPAFAEAAFGLEVGRWSGPVRSAYGWHLVRVDRLRPARSPELAEVRDKVVGRLRYDKERELLQQALQALRRRYEVVVGDWQVGGATS